MSAAPEPVASPYAKGACLCPFHARQVQETGYYDGECDHPSWVGGDGTLYGCDTITNPERAERYAARCAGLTDRFDRPSGAR